MRSVSVTCGGVSAGYAHDRRGEATETRAWIATCPGRRMLDRANRRRLIPTTPTSGTARIGPCAGLVVGWAVVL